MRVECMYDVVRPVAAPSRPWLARECGGVGRMGLKRMDGKEDGGAHQPSRLPMMVQVDARVDFGKLGGYVEVVVMMMRMATPRCAALAGE